MILHRFDRSDSGTALHWSDRNLSSEQLVSEAIRMDSSYIQDVFSEINRMRQADGTDPLTLDSADSDYSQAVWAYAEELATGIANNAPDFRILGCDQN
jgi:hypothetical protein